ncbi:MAG: class I SAM-dependent methyltransferase [Planctomycetota bacterium]
MHNKTSPADCQQPERQTKRTAGKKRKAFPSKAKERTLLSRMFGRLKQKAACMNQETDSVNPCGYCGATQSSMLYPTCSISQDEFYLNRCLKCSAVFLSPRPTQEQLEQAYDDSYYGRGEMKFTGPIEKVLDYFRSSRARRVNKYISPPAKILDIGCGNGRFLGYLIERGFAGYGVELPGKAADRAAQIPNLRLKVGRLEEGDFNENFFDGVCMWHVFEHLTAPKQTLQIIRRILKPNGRLLMSLPNIDSLQSRIFRGRWLHLDPPKHLFFLGPKQFICQIKQLGFRLSKLSYFSLEQNPFGIQQSILNCLLRKREILFEALKGNAVYVSEYSRLSITLQKIFYVSTFLAFAALAALEAALRKGGTMELIFTKHGD